MKERPILFSGPMVRAILDGTKTQTRRTAKEFDGLDVDAILRRYPNQSGCKYGGPGDRLWVKETYAIDADRGRIFYRADADDDGAIHYLMDGAGGFGGGVGHAKITRWKPSIFCTRAASRITLEITAVRVERLNDISEADAIWEGITRKQMNDGHTVFAAGENVWCIDARESYRVLWNSINGDGSWALNPWVWVIEFKRL
jgi:hypothetical protein